MTRIVTALFAGFIVTLFCIGCGGSGGGAKAEVNKVPLEGVKSGELPDMFGNKPKPKSK